VATVVVTKRDRTAPVHESPIQECRPKSSKIIDNTSQNLWSVSMDDANVQLLKK